MDFMSVAQKRRPEAKGRLRHDEALRASHVGEIGRYTFRGRRTTAQARLGHLRILNILIYQLK